MSFAFLLCSWGCGPAPAKGASSECEGLCPITLAFPEQPHFKAVWGDGRRVWAVGTGGSIAFHDGSTWHAFTVGEATLNAVGGDDSGRVIAVGDRGTVLDWREDGFARRELAPEFRGYDFSMLSVVGSEVWYAGHSERTGEAEAVILHETGGAVTTVWSSGTRAAFLTGLCALESGWVVALGGQGQMPEPLLLGGRADLQSLAVAPSGIPLACASSDDAIAVVATEGLELLLMNERAIRYIDPACDSADCPPFRDGANPAVFLAGPNYGFAVADVILTFGDDVAQFSPAPARLRGIHGTGANDVYAVGEKGSVVHYDGAAWTTVAPVTDAALSAVWVDDERVIAVGDRGTVLVDSGSRH